MSKSYWIAGFLVIALTAAIVPGHALECRFGNDFARDMTITYVADSTRKYLKLSEIVKMSREDFWRARGYIDDTAEKLMEHYARPEMVFEWIDNTACELSKIINRLRRSEQKSLALNDMTTDDFSKIVKEGTQRSGFNEELSDRARLLDISLCKLKAASESGEISAIFHRNPRTDGPDYLMTMWRHASKNNLNPSDEDIRVAAAKQRCSL